MSLKTILSSLKTVMLLNILVIMPESAAFQVRNATQAVRSALVYFKSNSFPQAPTENTGWAEKTLYAEGNMDYAVTGKEFSSTDWKIEVAQDVAPLSRTVYRVTVFNTSSGWYWQGDIKADGSICEQKAFSILSENEKQATAAEFIRQSRIPPPRAGGYGH